MTSLVANAVQAGITSNVSSIADKVAGGSNDQTANETDPEAQDDQSLDWKNPKDWCYLFPRAFLTVVGFLGLILLLVAFAGALSFGGQVFAGLVCAAAGLYATFEIWILGSMKDQIEFLKMLRKELQKDTDKLQGQVLDLSSETAELEENVKDLKDQGDLLRESVDETDRLNDELRETQSQLESANTELKGSVQGLSEQNDKLEATLEKMTAQYDLLEEEMKKFDELRETLSSMSADASENMAEMIQQTMSKFDDMDRLLHDNEVVLLQQLAADVEFLDDSEGMSENEYKRFYRRLPKRYKKIVDSKGWTFESLDHNGDKSIDAQELGDLIQSLIREHNESEV